MFNALEIKLDTFHCLKYQKTKQNKNHKEKTSNLISSREGEATKKINLYTQWIHIQNEKYHTKEKYHQIRKIHHLSYIAENIEEPPGSMGIGKTEHSFEVWDLVIVPVNAQPGEM